MRRMVLSLLGVGMLAFGTTASSVDPPICPIDPIEDCHEPNFSILEGENTCPTCVVPGTPITATLACQVASDGELCSAMPVALTSPSFLNYIWTYRVGSGRTQILPSAKDPLLGIICEGGQKVLVTVTVANGSYQASKTLEIRCGKASP
jgi:hypothetical protein